MFDFVKPVFPGYLCTYPYFSCRLSTDVSDDLDFTPCCDCEYLIFDEDYASYCEASF